MKFDIKDRIEQNFVNIIGEVDELHDEMEEDLQICVIEMIYAIDNWLKNENEKTFDRFCDGTFVCGILLTKKIGRKWSRLINLILKIRCNLIIYSSIKILMRWFT